MEPYSYVGNNPINFTDPTGMAAEWIPGTDDKAINSKDFRVGVVVNEGRREGESDPNVGVTYGRATPTDAEYDSNGVPQKITSVTINLYPKAYEEVVNFISANPGSKNAFDTA